MENIEYGQSDVKWINPKFGEQSGYFFSVLHKALFKVGPFEGL